MKEENIIIDYIGKGGSVDIFIENLSEDYIININHKRMFSEKEIRKAIDNHLSDLLLLPVNRVNISNFIYELFGEK